MADTSTTAAHFVANLVGLCAIFPSVWSLDSRDSSQPCSGVSLREFCCG
jgi:hypothetical protein